MTTFNELRRETRRLEILRLLAEAPEYEAGQHLLYAALPGRGLASSADQVAADLAWLGEQGLADVSEVGGLRLARITTRGLDVAAGRAVVPGVARPQPGA
jgi:hypothetical protein